MNKTDIKLNNERMFLLTYDLFMITGIISVSLLAPLIAGVLQKIICVIELLLLMLIEFRERKWNKKELMLGVLCVILFFLCYSKNPIELAVMYIFVFSSRNISFKKIVVHSYKITLMLLIIIISSAYFGIVDNMIFEGYRQALGFRYVLYAPSLFLNVVLLKIYMKGTEIKWRELVCLFVFNLFLKLKCHANLSFGLTTLVIIYICFCKIPIQYSQGKRKLIYRKIFSGSFFAFFVLSLVIVYFFSKNTNSWHWVDNLVSGRLSLSLRALEEYAVSFWGNVIQWVGNGADQYGNIYASPENYYYVDNAYLNLLLEEGVLFSFIVWIMYSITLIKCYEHKEKILMLILIVTSAYFVFDNLKLRLIYNTFWLLIPKCLLNVPLEGKKFLARRYNNEV